MPPPDTSTVRTAPLERNSHSRKTRIGPEQETAMRADRAAGLSVETIRTKYGCSWKKASDVTKGVEPSQVAIQAAQVRQSMEKSAPKKPAPVHPLTAVHNIDNDLSVLRRHLGSLGADPDRHGLLQSMIAASKRVESNVRLLLEFEEC